MLKTDFKYIVFPPRPDINIKEDHYRQVSRHSVGGSNHTKIMFLKIAKMGCNHDVIARVKTLPTEVTSQSSHS